MRDLCSRSATASKIEQLERYGATVHRVAGPPKNATAALNKRVGTVFYASHNWHPLFLHGVKTLAYEIAEQYDWNPPLHIVALCGGGSIIPGLKLGFSELDRLGRLRRMPWLHAVQAEACAPLIGARIRPKPRLAEGILSPKPPRLAQVKAAVSSAVAVSEPEIEEGVRWLAGQGVLVEPTSTSAVAGTRKLRIPRAESVLVILTGSGLKAHTVRVH